MSQRTCCVHGCEEPELSWGRCLRHYHEYAAARGSVVITAPEFEVTTNAFGLWQAVPVDPSAPPVVGHGLTAHAAIYRAQLKARLALEGQS